MELRRAAAALTLACSFLLLTSCLARRRVITRGKSAPTQTLLTAAKADLLSRIAAEYESIGSFSATVDMVPSVVSAIKGRITEYKDVRAFILFRKPEHIRIVGLYPVVRNTAFDMASNGTQFRLYIPSKNRFVEGPNELTAPSPNKLENLRPGVFLDALLVTPVDANKEISVPEDFTDEDNAAYIIHVLRNHAGQLTLARNIWFDRLNLRVVRQVIFDPSGEIMTDARYSEWQNYNGVPFPKVIDINRPKDEYGVVITVVKMDLNKPIADDKFVLTQPDGTTLQVLGTKPGQSKETGEPQAHTPAPRQ